MQSASENRCWKRIIKLEIVGPFRHQLKIEDTAGRQNRRVNEIRICQAHGEIRSKRTPDCRMAFGLETLDPRAAGICDHAGDAYRRRRCCRLDSNLNVLIWLDIRRKVQCQSLIEEGTFQADLVGADFSGP